MNKLAIPLIAAVSLAATQAQAGPKYRYSDDDRRDRYEDRRDRYEERDERRYGRQPARHQGSEYAEVISAQPIYRSVRIEEPRRECWDERVVYNDDRRDGRGEPWMNNGTGGAIVGAVIGGVGGHQFGKGRGKDAATVLGAIIGAGVGQRVALENSRPRERRESYERVGYEEVCKTVVEHRIEQRVEGYDVAYRYGGRTYHTSMPYDPGSRIPVDVNVRPVRY